MFEAEYLRQDLRLRDTHDHAGKTEDRPDRQVDIAGDDDEHHTGRHDSHGRGLHGKVPEVSRRQEQAAGQDMKSDPDQKKRADHAEQAGIKLRCADEARDGACLFRLGGRWEIDWVISAITAGAPHILKALRHEPWRSARTGT